ncbi:unnamed protein product, partial [Ixodes hexagonus]
MEDIKEFGDPDKLVSEEDLILIKLDRPCAQPLPDSLIADPTGHLISMNQKDFISCKEFLSNQHIIAALFAGCSAFDSSTSFEEAAKVILKNVDTLAVLHNKNLIPDLYSKSDRLKSLLLFHNLRIQTEDDPSWKLSEGGPYALTKLVGTTPAVGRDHLLIDYVPLSHVVRQCPKLTWIQAPMEIFLSTILAQVTGPVTEPRSWDRRHLILGIRREDSNGNIYLTVDATPFMLMSARQFFPRVQHLEVTTSCPESLLRISKFDSVQRLSMTGAFQSCRFDWYALPLLQRFDLEELALSNFENVQLSLVAGLCRALRSLSLEYCIVANEASFGDEFPMLRYLRFRCMMTRKRLLKFLSKCRNLVTLHLDRENIGAFVKLAPRLGLEKLEKLTLDTDRPLSKLGIMTGDLRRLVTSLPSLRYLVTDSYDVRWFFETHAADVTLAWVRCTICAAEFPKLGKVHR